MFCTTRRILPGNKIRIAGYNTKTILKQLKQCTMKQVLFLLIATVIFCSCNNYNGKVTNPAEQMKTSLLQQAGANKMDKSFTYEYMVQNDSAVGLLNLVDPASTISFTGDESTKGKLLNAFSTGDGKRYNTLLLKRGNTFVTRIVSIDGVVFEEHVYVLHIPEDRTPPLVCENDCSERCIQNCMDYFRRSILPGLQQRANETCKPQKICMACPLGQTPCRYILIAVLPEARYCNYRPHYPGDIAIRKMAAGIVIKNTPEGKTN